MGLCYVVLQRCRQALSSGTGRSVNHNNLYMWKRCMLVYAGVRYPQPIPGDGSGPEYNVLCFMTHVKVVVLIQSNRINHSVHQQAFFLWLQQGTSQHSRCGLSGRFQPLESVLTVVIFVSCGPSRRGDFCIFQSHKESTRLSHSERSLVSSFAIASMCALDACGLVPSYCSHCFIHCML